MIYGCSVVFGIIGVLWFFLQICKFVRRWTFNTKSSVNLRYALAHKHVHICVVVETGLLLPKDLPVNSNQHIVLYSILYVGSIFLRYVII